MAGLVVPALLSAAISSVPAAAYHGFMAINGQGEKPVRIASLRFDSKKKKYYIVGTAAEGSEQKDSKKEYDFKCVTLEQAMNHFSVAGFGRMRDKQEKEWLELMNQQHSSKPHQKVIMLFFKQVEEEKKPWWSSGDNQSEKKKSENAAKASERAPEQTHPERREKNGWRRTKRTEKPIATAPVEPVEEKKSWWGSKQEAPSVPNEIPKNTKSTGLFGRNSASTNDTKDANSRKNTAGSKNEQKSSPSQAAIKEFPKGKTDSKSVKSSGSSTKLPQILGGNKVKPEGKSKSMKSCTKSAKLQSQAVKQPSDSGTQSKMKLW